MKTKQLLIKTLLVAAGLCAGATGAWATDVPYNVGSSTADTWHSQYSDVWTLAGDGVLDITFTNHCVISGNTWENWLLYCGNSEMTTATAAENCYFVMRSDKWDDTAGSNVGFIVDDDYFTDFKTFQNEATVNLNIVRSGSTVSVHTTVTKDAVTKKMTFVKTGIADGAAKFYLSQNLSYMTVTAFSQTDDDLTGTTTVNALANYDNQSGADGAATAGSLVGGKGTMSFGGAFQVKIGDWDYRVGMRNGSSNISIASSEYAGSKDIVTVSFDLNYCQMGTDNKVVYFYLKDASDADVATLKVATQKSSPYFKEFSSNTLGITSDDIVINHNTTSSWGNKVHYTITLNYLTRKITTTTACAGATNTTSSHTVDMTNTNPLAKFVIGADYNSNYAQYRSQFDNLLIKTEKGDYNTTANITLAFKDNEDNDISALYTGTSAFTPEKSSTFTPSDYYPTVMYDDDYKYTYTSGGDAFTVSADATVTLVYTKSARPTYTFNVTANYGGKNKTIVNAVSVKEAADYTYYYPRFILDGTTLYEYSSSTDPNASGSYWTSTATNVSANGTYTLTYNAIEGECVYYSEGEDVVSKTGTYTYSNWKQYMSNGSAGVFESGTLTTLDAGIYTLTARVIGRAADRYGEIYKTSKEDANKLLHVVSANNGNEASSTFTLAASTEILADGGNSTNTNNGHGFDYIYIMKLPSYTVSKSISAAGWATYCSPYALDLANATGLTDAFIVTGGSDGVLAKTSVKEGTVPANTGLLLKGDEGTVTIPVVTSSATNVSANKLVGVTAETPGVAAGIYVLLNETSGDARGLGFYKTTNAFTVGANTAYLPDDFDGASARAFYLFDDGNTTAIEGVKTQQTIDGVYYNIAGQRVSQPTKGLYIVNGRKVVVK